MKKVKLLSVMSLVLLLSSCGVNNIPSYDENAKAKWAQVDNQYKRRTDLIPNLIATVKGFAAHERETLEAVVNARAKATSMNVSADNLTPDMLAQFQASQGALSSALSKLMVVVERYPELKSNQNFLALQTQLEGTENRISVARRDYIEAVRQYNTELKTYPGKLWHSFLYGEYESKPIFSVDEKSKEVPKVQF